MQRGFLNHFLHLHHHNTAVIVHRLGNNQCVEIHHLIFKSGVAFAVAGGSANEGDIWRNRFVIEIFFVIKLDQFNQVFFSDFIQFAALLAWIDKCSDANITNNTRLVVAAARKVCVSTPCG